MTDWARMKTWREIKEQRYDSMTATQCRDRLAERRHQEQLARLEIVCLLEGHFTETAALRKRLADLGEPEHDHAAVYNREIDHLLSLRPKK